MAWVTMTNNAGDTLTIPEPAYENMFNGVGSYRLVEEPKPTPKTKQTNTEEIKEVVDNGLQDTGLNEGNTVRKSTKKIVK